MLIIVNALEKEMQKEGAVLDVILVTALFCLGFIPVHGNTVFLQENKDGHVQLRGIKHSFL